MAQMAQPVLNLPGPSGRLDHHLALHCAPVIAGIKPANIISVKKEAYGSWRPDLLRVAKPLGAKVIYFFKLTECEAWVLLAIYNRTLLQWRLRAPNCASILSRYGYPAQESVGAALIRLSHRFRSKGDFPHEVGVFLGYPPEDVEYFIQNGGRNYRLCGYWKVYSDVEKARKIFSVYDSARRHFCQKVADGEEIYNITYGGTAI